MKKYFPLLILMLTGCASPVVKQSLTTQPAANVDILYVGTNAVTTLPLPPNFTTQKDVVTVPLIFEDGVPAGTISFPMIWLDATGTSSITLQGVYSLDDSWTNIETRSVALAVSPWIVPTPENQHFYRLTAQ